MIERYTMTTIEFKGKYRKSQSCIAMAWRNVRLLVQRVKVSDGRIVANVSDNRRLHWSLFIFDGSSWADAKRFIKQARAVWSEPSTYWNPKP